MLEEANTQSREFKKLQEDIAEKNLRLQQVSEKISKYEDLN